MVPRQPVTEGIPKGFGQRQDRKQKPLRTRLPMLLIKRERATGDDAMQVDVLA